MPTDLEYLIFALSDLVIDLSTPGFQQRPACGYALTETYGWTIPTDAPIVSANTYPEAYTLTTSSYDALTRGDYDVNLAFSGRYETTGVLYTNDISFTITVTDPCITTVLTDFTIPDVSIEAGLIDEHTFIEVTDSAATAVGDSTICGARTYEIFEVTIDPVDNVTEILTVVNFITLETLNAAVDYKLTVHSEDEDNEVGVHNMRLVTTL